MAKLKIKKNKNYEKNIGCETTAKTGCETTWV